MTTDFDLVFKDPSKATMRAIHKYLRAHDASFQWPIRGRFNATDRAIRRLANPEAYYGKREGYKYFAALDQEIRTIVNNTKP